MGYLVKPQRPGDGGEMDGEVMDGAELYKAVPFDFKKFTRQQLAALGERALEAARGLLELQLAAKEVAAKMDTPAKRNALKNKKKRHDAKK